MATSQKTSSEHRSDARSTNSKKQSPGARSKDSEHLEHDPVSDGETSDEFEDEDVPVTRWPALACGAAAAVGVAWAAAFVSRGRVDRDVGVAAWVAAAVVGASATISAASGPLPGYPRLAMRKKRMEERTKRRLAFLNRPRA